MLHSKVKWSGGLQFVGESETGHAIVVDADPEAGGSNTGMRPMELLLIGIGGCSGMDVASILQKKKQAITSLEVNLKGEKADSYPQKFTAIDLEFVVRGEDLSEEAVKKAIDLSMDKYCSVKATVEGVARITYAYKILPA
ncbi:MAG: OsmC family protein [Dissulfurispiraceae bacterium]